MNHNAKVPSSSAGYMHRKIFPYKMGKMRILDEKSQEAPDFLADAYLCFFLYSSISRIHCYLLFVNFLTADSTLSQISSKRFFIGL